MDGRSIRMISSEKECRGSGMCSHANPICRASSSEDIFSDTPVTSREALSLVAACTMASNGFTPGMTSSSTGLPSFSAISTT